MGFVDNKNTIEQRQLFCLFVCLFFTVLCTYSDCLLFNVHTRCLVLTLIPYNLSFDVIVSPVAVEFFAYIYKNNANII